MSEDYVPDLSDIIWAQRTIAEVKEGGIVAFPKSELIYRVEKSRRVWVLQTPGVLTSHYNMELHKSLKNVLSFINWTVE